MHKIGDDDVAVRIDGWSVTAQYRKCGKPLCRVCTTSQGHGPYYYGTRRVDGHLQSRYFGRDLPQCTPDKQDDAQEISTLRQQIDMISSENEALRIEIDRLRVEAEALRIANEPPSAESTVPSHRELTREEVETIWMRAVAHISSTDTDLVIQAQDHLMRGLFPGGVSQTQLAIAGGPRPYRCPFRGNRRGGRFYATPERLVETAIPWILEFTSNDQKRQRNHEARKQAQTESQLADLRRRSSSELLALREKLARDLDSQQFFDWILTEPEMRQLQTRLEAVLREREGNL